MASSLDRLTAALADRYTIERELGAGGMATVYLAEDLKHHRKVAVKVLRPELAAALGPDRFLREIEITANLNHPNVLTLLDSGEADGFVYYVMPYVEGETLRDRLARENMLPVEEVLRIASELADALGYAHGRGVIHRDIKPENILLDAGHAFVTDFGIARAITEAGGENLTQTGIVVGTPGYMSPEQATGDTRIDNRSDIYSLGCVVYEMLGGEPPHTGPSPQAIVARQLSEEARSVIPLRSSVTPAVDAALRKALMPAAVDRFAAAKEFAAALEAGATAPVPRAVHNKKRRAVLGVAAAAVVLGAAWFLLGRGAPVEAATVRIAVIPFVFEGDDQWTWFGDAMAELVSTELEREPSLSLPSRQELVALGTERGGSDEEGLEQALQASREVRAEIALVGEIRQHGDSATVSATLFQTESGDRMATLASQTGTLRGLPNLAVQLAAEVVAGLGVRPRESGDREGPAAERSLEFYQHFLAGREAARDRRYEQALTDLQAAMAADSTSEEVYRWLAWVLDQTGRTDSAKTVLARGEQYVRTLSEKRQLEYLLDVALINARYDSYASYLERLLRTDPDDAYNQYRYGWVLYYRMRRMAEGIAAMQRAVELDSTQSEAFNDLAYAFVSAGDLAAAFEMVERYAELNPADLNPLDSKAEMLLFAGRYEEAIELADRILARDPEFLSTRSVLIRALIERGELVRALEEIDWLRSIATDWWPHYVSQAWVLESEVHLRSFDYSRALVAADRAVLADSSNLQAHWVRARALLSDTVGVGGELDLMEELVAGQGGSLGRWHLLHVRARLASAAGDYRSARRALGIALDLRPRERPFYLNELASVQGLEDEPQEAVRTLREALEFNPNYAPALLQLGELLQELGSLAEADLALQHALEVWAEADADFVGRVRAQQLHEAVSAMR